MNITLRQLRAFVAVAECGRFRLAAERMHVTPAALSMLIRELESQMDLPLFERHTRMVRLTEAGREFLPVARGTLTDLELALQWSRERARLQRGRVCVAAAIVLAATLLPPVMRRFSEAHPGVRVELRDVAEEELPGRLKGGDVELAVGTSLERDPELAETLLARDDLRLVCSADHPLASRRRVRWAELAGERFIALGAGNPLRTLVDGAAAGAGFSPAYEVRFSTTAISMVAAGLGVAVLPANSGMLAPRVRIAVLELEEPRVTRDVVLFTRRSAVLSPAAAAFRDMLVASMAAPGDAPSR